MFQLTIAYVHQADRERDITADLNSRQLLRSAADALAPAEPSAPVNRAMRRTPARVRAASR
jgi:hypothetical protein